MIFGWSLQLPNGVGSMQIICKYPFSNRQKNRVLFLEVVESTPGHLAPTSCQRLFPKNVLFEMFSLSLFVNDQGIYNCHS